VTDTIGSQSGGIGNETIGSQRKVLHAISTERKVSGTEKDVTNIICPPLEEDQRIATALTSDDGEPV